MTLENGNAPAPSPREIAAQLRCPSGTLGTVVGERMNRTNERLYAPTWDALRIVSGARVLEIGFGNGRFFSALMERHNDLHLFGIDLSADMVREAQESNERAIEEGQLDLQQGNTTALPFADGSMDRIYGVNVIYFWDRPEEHLREIRRVLSSEGIFVATFRSAESMRHLPFAPHGFTLYEERDWSLVLRANGFLPLPAMRLEEKQVQSQGGTFDMRSYIMPARKA